MRTCASGGITDCAFCSHALMEHDLQAGPKKPRCLGTFPEDPEEGDHRAGCPPITEDDTCGCPGYQPPQVFSYDQVVELLRLFSIGIATLAPRAPSRPPEHRREAAASAVPPDAQPRSSALVADGENN